jgi:hypothetical protein
MTTLHGARDQQPDKEKLRQLALYVAHRSENDPRFGRVKFNKILFYCDFMHYLKTGRSITGYSYIKMEFGPCPEDFDILEKEMDKADELKLQTRERYGLIQKRPIALIEYDLKKFTGEEIATITASKLVSCPICLSAGSWRKSLNTSPTAWRGSALITP